MAEGGEKADSSFTHRLMEQFPKRGWSAGSSRMQGTGL
jgi:hypothetical protein